MTVGRVIAGVATSAAVVGCAVAVVAMAQARPGDTVARETSAAVPTPTYRPAHPPMATTSAASTAASTAASSHRPAPAATRAHPAAVATTPAAPSSSSVPAPVLPTHAPPRTTAPPVARHTVPHAPAPRRTTAAPAPRPAGTRLPLGYPTGDATRVITVVGRSASSTTATLQGWVKSSGGWTKWGPTIKAYVGADGLGHASEYRSATPTGSFTLTQAFGYYSDPGTGLPYFKTTWADWWISTAGSQYNTHQRCSSCGYASPDEHLVTETPYYNYAVVIDTPSGASAYPGGSAFFLHVSVGQPTAGCVAIPQSNLVAILRWLAPWSHPRILIGVA